MYTRYTCIYTIYTPNTPPNTPFTPYIRPTYTTTWCTGTWELTSSDDSSATFKLDVHMAWEGIPFPLVLPALDIAVGFEGSNRASNANDPPAITRGLVGRLTPWEEAPGGGAGTFRFRQQTGVQIVPVKLVIQDDPAVTGGCFRPLAGTVSLYIESIYRVNIQSQYTGPCTNLSFYIQCVRLI